MKVGHSLERVEEHWNRWCGRPGGFVALASAMLACVRGEEWNINAQHAPEDDRPGLVPAVPDRWDGST